MEYVFLHSRIFIRKQENMFSCSKPRHRFRQVLGMHSKSHLTLRLAFMSDLAFQHPHQSPQSTTFEKGFLLITCLCQTNV